MTHQDMCIDVGCSAGRFPIEHWELWVSGSVALVILASIFWPLIWAIRADEQEDT